LLDSLLQEFQIRIVVDALVQSHGSTLTT